MNRASATTYVATRVTAIAVAHGQTTSYTYDAGSRLASVTAGSQSRTFQYDLRGFLLWEQHPELGISGNGKAVDGSSQTAGTYDARGHAHRKVTGTVDITTDFDAAERVKNVTETGGNSLATFVYDDPSGASNANCTGGKCKGKLATAARYNYAPDHGTVMVSDKYQYDGVGGLPSRRDRAIGSSSSFDGQSFFFGRTYNSLGAVDTLTYPCRVVSDNCASGTGERTPPNVVMT